MMQLLTDWVVYLMTALGYPGLFLVMLLENVFPPIPSEVILPLAGSLTLNGTFNLWAVTLVGAAGSVIGAWVFYALGRWFDEARLRGLVRRYGKWAMLSETDLDRAVSWFQRHGESTVFFCRMVPLVRSLISVPAGMAHMNAARFTLLTALGTTLWSLALALAGRLLGQGWSLVSDFVDGFQWVTIAALVALTGGFLAVRLYQRLNARLGKE